VFIKVVPVTNSNPKSGPKPKWHRPEKIVTSVRCGWKRVGAVGCGCVREQRLPLLVETRNLLTEGNGDHEEDRGGGEGEGVCLEVWSRYIVTTLVNIGDY